MNDEFLHRLNLHVNQIDLLTFEYQKIKKFEISKKNDTFVIMTQSATIANEKSFTIFKKRKQSKTFNINFTTIKRIKKIVSKNKIKIIEFEKIIEKKNDEKKKLNSKTKKT